MCEKEGFISLKSNILLRKLTFVVLKSTCFIGCWVKKELLGLGGFLSW